VHVYLLLELQGTESVEDTSALRDGLVDVELGVLGTSTRRPVPSS
jgi:hypothetical protein